MAFLALLPNPLSQKEIKDNDVFLKPNQSQYLSRFMEAGIQGQSLKGFFPDQKVAAQLPRKLRTYIRLLSFGTRRRSSISMTK
jgi:hypothetical protein